MSRYFCLTGLASALLLCQPQSSHAIVRTWDDGGGNKQWLTDANWSPNGEPQNVDDVFIGAHPNATDDTVIFGVFPPLTATVFSLELSNGADLDLNNGRLVVIEDTTVGGGLGGGTLTELIVSPVEGMSVDAVSTNTLTIGVGGRLTMSGASISVDGSGASEGVLEIQEGGAVFGYGVIDLDDDNVPAGVNMLVNDGTITVGTPGLVVIGEPPSRTLQINAPNDPEAPVNLDGTGNDGELIISRNSTLELNVDQTGFFQGVIHMFGNSTLELGDKMDLLVMGAATNESASLIIDSGQTDGIVMLPAVPAVISGEVFLLDVNGTISLDESDEVLIFESQFRGGQTAEAGGMISNAGTIHFAGDALIFAGTSIITSGSGSIVNDAGSDLRLFDGVDADTPVTNDGDLWLGNNLFRSAAQIDAFTQPSSGTLNIQIEDVIPGDYDVLTVEGNAVLGGTLAITLLDGFEPLPANTFTILETTSGNVGGQFDDADFPVFNGMTFGIEYNPQSVVLGVVDFYSADFDHDGDVDNDDLAKWEGDYGQNGFSDADGDSDSDGLDFLAWQQQYTGDLSPLSSATAVPEPNALLVALVSLTAYLGRRPIRVFA